MVDTETGGSRRALEGDGSATGVGRRAGERPARVLVVDDHRALAESLALAIDSQPDLESVGTALTVADARRLATAEMPDILLIDVQLPDGDGIEIAGQLRAARPELRIVVLTGHTDVAVLARAATAGVCGFLPKESGVADVLSALRTARGGGMVVDGATLSAVLDRVSRLERPPAQAHAQTQAPAEASDLTEREMEVLRAMGSGMDPQTIAVRLGVSVHTSRGHVKSILSKLESHSQLEAVVTAIRRGLLPELFAV
jgi:DNA-binding NarL/FixJ family response regulator